MIIRDCSSRDSEQISEIYNHYILNSYATFEEEPLNTETISSRICKVTESYPWLVCEHERKILGYAYANTWKSRSAYRYTCEVTIYLDVNHCARGVGRQLYDALIQQLKMSDCRVALACISLPNRASVSFHEKFGFDKVAHFEKVGRKFDRWIDVGYWQLSIKEGA